MKIILLLAFAFLFIIKSSAQQIQNGGFEEGSTATNISQIYKADFWDFGCEGTADLFDCQSPPPGGGFPGPSPVVTPVDCINPRDNGEPNCRFGAITCDISASESIKNELTSELLPNVEYELNAWVARGTLPSSINQPTFRRIEAVLRIENCDAEIIIPIPIDIPYGDCDWIPVTTTFQITSAQSMTGFDFIEFRGVPKPDFDQERVYIDDVELERRTTGLESEPEEYSKTLTIFPNPAKDELNIVSKDTFDIVVVQDLTGNEVLKLNASDKISVTQLNPGIYFLSIFNNKYEVIDKVRFVKF